ncbi:hypothetical protein RR48_01671 [Papilio machaon]|uniref:EGF-like domain-containing protein n=1 Tax=Papilio machaon TaxID=76193 RepID=A0A0N1ING4_PAPMA|nr:hypothetical protein RR48_01671 [Papilio machaon]
MEPCDCPAHGSWECDPVRGCVCRRGYIGEQCDVHAADAIHIDHASVGSSNAGLTTVMVIMVLLCAAAAILVLLYYRKRVRNLKREIAHVHYTADPNQPPEQHFDNPVYSFQSSTRSDESASTLLNNSNKIFNNLNPASKLNNATLEKDFFNELSTSAVKFKAQIPLVLERSISIRTLWGRTLPNIFRIVNQNVQTIGQLRAGSCKLRSIVPWVRHVGSVNSTYLHEIYDVMSGLNYASTVELKTRAGIRHDDDIKQSMPGYRCCLTVLA